MPRRSLSEFFAYFDNRPRDHAYAQSAGYRTARWTYQKVAETAGRFARELESRGVNTGDRIVLLGPNSAGMGCRILGQHPARSRHRADGLGGGAGFH